MSGNTKSESIVSVQNLGKKYGSIQGLAPGFCCEIERGVNTVLLGSNGAGKSTLMSIMVGLRKQDTGEVFIDGVSSLNPSSRERLRYLPEDVEMPKGCNLLDLVREYNKNGAMIDTDAVKELAGQFRCSDRIERKMKSLSKGQRRLLLLSLILSGNPKTVILDEPMEALDPTNIHLVRNRINQMCKSGTTVLQSTHRIHEAQRQGGNYLIIHDGVNKASGTMNNMKNTVKLPLEVADSLGIPAEHRFLSSPEHCIVNREGLSGDTAQKHATDVTLEDIFLVAVE